MAVPNTTQVIPGARVHIVLKADQTTGRLSTGTVQQVLTRGDHPRGIKVRLADGRIGRVQSLARQGDDETSIADDQEASLPTDHGRPRWKGRQREEQELPQEQVGLDAYIKPARTKQRGKKSGGADVVSTETSTATEQDQETPLASPIVAVTCPVCGDFEGDEAAVAHHVAGHFDT